MVVATSFFDLAFDKLRKGCFLTFFLKLFFYLYAEFTAPAPEISGFVMMKDIEVSDIRPSISEVKQLPHTPSLKRQRINSSK